MKEWNLRWCCKITRERIKIMFLIAIFCVTIGGSIGFYKVAKTRSMHEVSVTLLLKDLEDNVKKQTELDYEKYQALNQDVINHFSSLLEMDIVIDKVIQNLNLDMNYEDFKEKLEITSGEDLYMLELRVIDEDLDLAEKMADELIVVASKEANEILGIEKIQNVSGFQSKPIPQKHRTKQYIGVSLIFGILLGLLITEYIDKTIGTFERMGANIGLPIIGIIEDPCIEDFLVICNEPDYVAAETYRNMAMKIRSMQEAENIKTIVLTSPELDRYRSVVTTNVAISFSKMDKHVLLIDCDLREGNITRLFDLSHHMGISEVLDGSIQLESAIINSKEVDNLAILPTGHIAANSADLLALDSMRGLIEKTKNDYDLILIDSPPLGTLADAVILSTVGDGTILVCGDAETNIRDIKQGKKRLEMVNSIILGAVLRTRDVKEYSHMGAY